jgi:hypothetical protein
MVACKKTPMLSADGLKQDGIPVEFEESLLPGRKSTYVHGIRGVDSHSFERRAMGHRRNDEPSTVFETDESTVEEVVNARRQEQPVLAVKALFVRGIPPGLAMARDEMNRVLNPGYLTPRFNLTYAVLEKALPLPRPDDGRPIRFWNGGVVGHLSLQPTLPRIEVIGRPGIYGFRLMRNDLEVFHWFIGQDYAYRP